MRILLGYINYEHPTNITEWYESWLARLRSAGTSVEGFCLTLDQHQPNLLWPELDARWRRGDKALLTMYETLANRLQHYDVFVNFNGINLHPDFVRQLSTFNVYGCFDDPESSEVLSRPVAAAYDLAMVGNVAELDTYRSWGVEEVRFWPLGFRAGDYDPKLTRQQILSGERDCDVALTCERLTPWRRERVDKFAAAFPQGQYYGKGWPNGFLPESERIPLYQRSKIGINIHNSTGPINFRTFIMPANGVLQLCDNKSHLGQVYAPTEAVGFDTIDEAIDLCAYYLNHDRERREIAAAGWERALRDYNEVAVFKLMTGYVEQLMTHTRRDIDDKAMVYLHQQRQQTAVPRALYRIRLGVHSVRSGISYLRNAGARRLQLLRNFFTKQKARA